MGKFQIIVGFLWIIFAAWIFYISKSWVALIINLIIGIALIVFNNEENKLEQRKDINTKHSKK